MAQEHHLSPFTAILININVMLGSGIFLNITELAQRTGSLGFICYALVGLLLLPLVVSMAALLKLYPAGGFYTFAAHDLGPTFGFISAWSYFVGKLASATIIMHAAVTIIQKVIPALNVISPFVLDTCIIGLFVVLNMLNLKTGSIIQSVFTALKLLPVACVIIAGLCYFKLVNFSVATQVWSGVPLSLPLVVYAVIGFEVACSISAHIKDARKNAPRVIMISYSAAVALIILFQFLFYSLLGNSLAVQPSFKEAYPLFFAYLFPAWSVVAIGAGILCNSAIAISALGGAYGILFSNSWNLHTLAQHGHIFKSSWFTRLNRHAIPFACVLAEGALCLLYLTVSGGKQIVLQQLGVLGVISSLSISVCGLIAASRGHARTVIAPWVPCLGLFNCLLLMAVCIRGLLLSGPASLVSFLSLVLLGYAMFFYKQRRPTVIQSARPINQ